MGSHLSKSCPINSSNMMKIIGNSGLSRGSGRFYDLVKTFEDSTAEACRRKDENADSRFFTLQPLCPEMSSCQTLSSWKFEMLTCKINRMFAQRSLNKPRMILYFLPIGPFPDFIHEFQHNSWTLMQLLGNFLKSFFLGSEVKFLPEANISDIRARSRKHELTEKLQYHVSDIIMYLQKELPPDGFAIIGLSWYDMYPCDNLNFILGQGSCSHSACVSSFGRFDPNFVKGFKGQERGILPEQMKDITKIDGNVIWKLLKILSHETCHVFGISHCTVFECLMNESKSSSEALSQPLFICPLCMSKIQHLQTALKTNVVKSDEITVLRHLSSLYDFVTVITVSEKDSDLYCEKMRETETWLKELISYLTV